MVKASKQEQTASKLQSQEDLFTSRPPGGRSKKTKFIRRYLLRSVEIFLYWMPVWVPLILLAQLGTRGLKPALKEEERLRRHEQKLEVRLDEDADESQRLEKTRKALDDPIYIERLRRQRQESRREEVELRNLAPIPPGQPEAPRGQ